MSFVPRPMPKIPERTALVAQRAFPKRTIYMELRDCLDSLYEDKDFVELFGRRGQPGWSAGRLALITLMQFIGDLTDRQAADAVRGRIDWKYALSLELEDAGIDASVLSEFRQRLLEGSVEEKIFNKLLVRCQEKGWLEKGGKQRTDSTHVEASLRNLHRLELLGETLRAALNSLAASVPEWLSEIVSEDWFDRYSRRVEEYQLPRKKLERDQWALIVGADGHHLLNAIYTTPNAPDWLRQIPAVEVLRQVWVQQFYLDSEHHLHLRDPKQMPPTRKQICSPYELEARYSRKRQTTWVGYKVHLTEICDAHRPHLITHVQTTPATTADGDLTPDIHQVLHNKGLSPDEHLVDSAYLDASLLVESLQQHQIELLGPVLPDTSWQAQSSDGFDISQFEINWSQQQARCPQGVLNSTWDVAPDRRGQDTVRIRFPYQSCQACPVKTQCTRATHVGRTITLRPQPQHLALQQARRYQQTDEFKQRYARRAGIEGTLSQGVNAFGLRYCRYKGLAKTHLQHIFTATAMNVVRLINWLHGQPFATTRISHFASLSVCLC